VRLFPYAVTTGTFEPSVLFSGVVLADSAVASSGSAQANTAFRSMLSLVTYK